MSHRSARSPSAPWATCALLLVAVLGFLPTHLAGHRSVTQGLASLERAATFHREHPHLAVPPRLVGTLRPPPLPPGEEPATDRFRALEQVELDGLGLTGLDSLASSPHGRWGFSPARGSLITLATHLGLHAGVLPLVANLLLLALVGPALESAWGPGRFVALTLGAGVVGAIGLWVQEPALAVPLVGATGAVAGAVGAFLVLHGRQRVQFLGWLGAPFGAAFRARAWIICPLWGARELLGVLVPDVLAPAPAGPLLAAGAHGVALLAGVLGGIALRWGHLPVRLPLRRTVSRAAVTTTPATAVAAPPPKTHPPPPESAPPSPPPPPERMFRVVPALPSDLGPRAVTIETPTSTGRLDLGRVEALAAAAIDDGGAEANFVLDLVVRRSTRSTPPQVLRFETRRFNPSTFYPAAPNPEAAFHAFIEGIASASQAKRLWPGVPPHLSRDAHDEALAEALASPP